MTYRTTVVDDLLDQYVLRVVKRLPRRRRRDVAVELRSLLRDELDERTVEAGEDDVRALLEEFGRPADVAARYETPPGVVDPADARQFVRLAVGGVLVIWLVGLAATVGGHGDEGVGLVAQRWWWGVALPALWWPGLLVVCFAGAARARRRWPSLGRRRPRPRDEARVNRPAVVVRGRWQPLTRRISLGLSVATGAVLLWVALAGDVFRAAPTDDLVKLALWLTVLGTAADGAVRLTRRLRRVPTTPAGLPGRVRRS